MTLDQLKIGASGTITSVGGDGPLRCRLLDMGLIPRTRVTLQKIAPMGDPIEIRVRGYELTLRVEEAEKIEVKEDALMVFALVGNQNCGKTTLFNALTGSNQHVGNFPGVTVDQKIGRDPRMKRTAPLWTCRASIPCGPIRRRRSLPGTSSSIRSPTASSISWTPPTSSGTCI